VTSSWFFLSTLNYDARSTTHQIGKVRLRNLSLVYDLFVPHFVFIFTFQVVSKFFLLPGLTLFCGFPDRIAAFVTSEKLSLFTVMHLCLRLELQLHTFLTSILDGWRYVVTSILHPLYPRERSRPSWPLHGRRGRL